MPPPAAVPPPTMIHPAAMPLPTYAQSEKYEVSVITVSRSRKLCYLLQKDGVLEYANRDDGMVRIVVSNQPRLEQSFGTSLEFILFFLGKENSLCVVIRVMLMVVSLSQAVSSSVGLATW